MFLDYKPTISYVTELTLRKQKGTKFSFDWLKKYSASLFIINSGIFLATAEPAKKADFIPKNTLLLNL